jgi:hypothetical protein
LFGEWVCAKGGRDRVCHTFPQPSLLTAKTPRTPRTLYSGGVQDRAQIRSFCAASLARIFHDQDTKTPRASLVIESVESGTSGQQAAGDAQSAKRKAAKVLTADC